MSAPRRSLFLGALLSLAPFVSAAALSDCNGSGVSDVEEIAAGLSEDCDGDAIPDECEASPPPFGSIRPLEIGASASSFAIVDIDGDRRVDIAVGTGPSDGFGVSLFLAQEDGRLEEHPSRLASTREILDIVAADLDGDGLSDLVLRDAGGIRGFLNRGPDGFSDRFTVSRRDDMSAIAATDLNGDGLEDVISTQRQGNLLAVFLSQGDGTFDPLPDHELPAPSDMAVGDVNGDGDDEVVVAAADGLSIFASPGDGTLVELETVNALGESPRSPVLGDIDQDGRLDIALATEAGFVMLLNQGGETFAVSSSYSHLAEDPGRELAAFALGDVDFDGDPDPVLAIGQPGAPGGLVFLVNGGAGSFRFTLPFGLEASPRQVVLQDLDTDGDDELLVLSRGRDRIEIFWSEPGSLEERQSLSFRKELVPLSDSFEPHVSHLRDVDEDGDLDVVTMDGEDRVMVVTNDGVGRLLEGERYSPDGAAEIISIVSVDLDNDGHVDIAANDESTDELYVLWNQGDGTFNASGEAYPTGANPSFLAADDVDGDGFQDLLSVNRADDTVGVFFNLHDGTFDAEQAVDVCDVPVGAAPGDFDGDGDIDLAVICSRSSTLSILHNEGDGTFSDPVELDITTPRYVIAADMDADRDIDLVVAHQNDRSLGLFLNDGQGILEAADVIGIGGRPRSVIACDLNGDGRMDLVGANEQDDSISVVVFPEPGVPPQVSTYGVGQDPRYAVAGDLDGDGAMDILSANHSSFDFTVLFNQTSDSPPASPPPYLERICTELDYYEISIPSTPETAAERVTRFLIPLAPGPIPPLLENARAYASQHEFLSAVFPEIFPDLTESEYDLLVRHRASRQYFSGAVYRLRSRDGLAYGFDIATGTSSGGEETPRVDEVRSVYETLEGIFELAPLAYYPLSGAARSAASAWLAPGFPVYMAPYQRGDITADGTIDLTDVIVLLDHLFRAGPASSCRAATDTNEDGELDISDSITLIIYLFLGRQPLGSPFEHCGWDPTPNSLDCLSFPPCEG